MAQLTIKGQIFDINDDPRITVGTPLDEGMVASLQQTRRENIRNNLSKKVEDALGDNEDLSVEEHSRLQDLVNEYAENYKFGARQAGTPRVVDPVEREARREVAEVIKAAYYRRHGDRLKGDALADAVDQLMESKGAQFRERAKQRIAEREAAGEDVLAATGLAA